MVLQRLHFYGKIGPTQPYEQLVALVVRFVVHGRVGAECFERSAYSSVRFVAAATD